MQTAPQPAPGYYKGSTVAQSSTHIWARCDADPRVWVVFPLDLQQDVQRAIVDDLGNLVPVASVQ